MSAISSSLNTAIAVVYPTYKSAQVVLFGGEDAARWILYWVIFSALCILDIFMDFQLNQVHGFLIRNLFVLWCMAPVKFNGVSILDLQVKEES